MFNILDTTATFSRNVFFREMVKTCFKKPDFLVTAHLSLKISLKFLWAFQRYEDILL